MKDCLETEAADFWIRGSDTYRVGDSMSRLAAATTQCFDKLSGTSVGRPDGPEVDLSY